MLSKISELLGCRTKPAKEHKCRHDYGLRVVDLILQQYPEIEINSREIVKPDNWNWDNGIYVKVELQNRGNIELYIKQERIRMPKVRHYSIESALDDEALDKDPNEMARRLKEAGLDNREYLGYLSTILCHSGGIGPIEWQRQSPGVVLAGRIAGDYGFDLSNLDNGFVTLMACDIKAETLERFVRAVKQYEIEARRN